MNVHSFCNSTCNTFERSSSLQTQTQTNTFTNIGCLVGGVVNYLLQAWNNEICWSAARYWQESADPGKKTPPIDSTMNPPLPLNQNAVRFLERNIPCHPRLTARVSSKNLCTSHCMTNNTLDSGLVNDVIMRRESVSSGTDLTASWRNSETVVLSIEPRKRRLHCRTPVLASMRSPRNLKPL